MDIFSTGVLTRTINYLPQPSSFLLDRYFPDVIVSDKEVIYFDVMNGKRRMSPFVSPLVQGKIVESQGHVTNSLIPAYIKDKRVFDPTRPFRRAPGEMLAGDMSAEQRAQALMAIEMEDQKQMFTRRMEWMAAQALATGGYTISGEKYQTVVINFGRASAQQVVLSGGARWGQAGVAVLDNLQTWASAMLKLSGLFPTDIVMDVNAWEIFRKDPTVVQQRQFFQNPNPLDIQSAVGGGGTGAQYMMSIGGFKVFVYQEWYVDDNGTEQPMLPANTVMLLSPLMEGVRHFGAIKDYESLSAVPYFAKSWLERDPSVRYVLFQSAPLVVPYRPNASFAVTVN